MVWSVAVFGVATAAFGVSKVYWFSWVMLAVIGASDTVSTVLRQTIRQLVTPNHLRGRMTSINMMFFMGGPQLGELEAGSLAAVGWCPDFRSDRRLWILCLRSGCGSQVKELDELRDQSMTWTPLETNTHQDHVIAHVIGATPMGHFIWDETAYILLDIGFIWNIYLDLEMGLVPHSVAIAELDADEEMKSELRSKVDQWLSGGVLRVLNLLRFLNQEMSGDWCCCVSKGNWLYETSFRQDGFLGLTPKSVLRKGNLFPNHGDLVVDCLHPLDLFTARSILPFNSSVLTVPKIIALPSITDTVIPSVENSGSSASRLSIAA